MALQIIFPINLIKTKLYECTREIFTQFAKLEILINTRKMKYFENKVYNSCNNF